MGAKEALERYYRRLDRPRRPKNGKPEKELVEKPCVAWMRAQRWEVEMSKAEATKKSWGGYSRGSLELGMTDTRGYDRNDRPFFIEFKAPGKLKNVWGKTGGQNENRQAEFIKKQIRRNSFAVAVDSLDLLVKLWTRWTRLVDENKYEEARKCLLKSLPPQPKRRKNKKQSKEDPEMGF